ncbi:CCHC-type domain-containing protein [Trichonephila clavipes]|nr:CCHC-type domain-containing protein [Trichonephila clavipes]
MVKTQDLGKQCDIFYASKGKSYDGPARAKWNDNEKRIFNGSWGKQPFGGEKSQIIFLLGKNFDKGQVTEIKKFACFTCGSDKHFKRDCPKNKVPIGLATGGQVNVVHQQVLCTLAEVLAEDVLLPPDVLDMLGGAQSEENSQAQRSQDLRVNSGNVDETEVSLGILPEKAQVGAH